MSYLAENALSLRSKPQGGRPILLKIKTGRFNRISFSARLGEQWLNGDLTIDEWPNFTGYISQAVRSTEAVEFDIVMSKNNQPYGKLSAGRDEDGLVYVKLENNGKGAVRFEFLPKNQFIHLKNGQPIPESDLTRGRAMKWVNLITPMVERSWITDYKEEQAGPQGGGGGYQRQNYGGGNGGGNGGYQQRPQQAPVVDGDLDSYLP